MAIDLIKGQHKQPDHMARNPWGKMPAFEHAGLRFYETSAIMRYIDDAFSGPALMPSTPAERVRVNQLMSIVDSYGYAASITNIFIPCVLVPSLGGQTGPEAVQSPKARPLSPVF